MSSQWILFLFWIFMSFAQAQTVLRSSLWVDQANLGDVNLRFTDPKRDLSFSKSDLETLLSPVISESKWERLQQANSGLEWISSRELERIGIQTEFDEKLLEVHCQIPMNLRRIQILSLDRRSPLWGVEITSDPRSGYLNLSTIKGLSSSDQVGWAHSDALEGQAELVQHLGPTTLESLWMYREHETHPWERGDTALVTDLEDLQTRIRLGDSSPLTMDYMSALSSGGIHIYRQFGIDPARPSVGLRSSLIQVLKSSWLEISVNKVVIAKLRVQPGPINLRDLPLLVGRNRVHIKLTDDFERSEEFDVDLFFDSSLLGKGIHDFSYFLGEPWISDNRERKYQKDSFLSLMHRYGLSEQITLGLSGQSYQDQRVAGSELDFLSPFGTFQTNFATSRNNTRVGVADHWRFRTNEQDQGFFRITRFSGDYEHRSSEFTLPALTNTSLPEFSSRLEGQFQTLVGIGKSLTYGGGYQWGQNGLEDARFYRGGFQMAFHTGLRVDLSFVRTIRSFNEEQWLFNLTWSEPTGLFSSNALYDSLNHQTLFSAHKNAQTQINDFSADVNWQQSSAQSDLGLRANYLGTHADWLFQHDSSSQDAKYSHQTRAGVSTALAWAGGRAALSRPIQDSYILLAATDMPKGGKLSVNPGNNTAEATLESWDNLVLPNLASYQKTGIQIDSTALPMGYSLEREAYHLRPKYRSGIYVNLGLAKKVYARGRLSLANGKPLAFASGMIFNSRNQLVSDSFFTDAQGVFVVDQIPAGTYQLKLREAGYKPLTLNFPDTTEEVDLGSISVAREEGM